MRTANIKGRKHSEMLDSVAKVGCDLMLDSKLTHPCSIDFMPHGMPVGCNSRRLQNLQGHVVFRS